eukprot:scaffold12492_cov98-Isochrysis_galbana.AAC.5
MAVHADCCTTKWVGESISSPRRSCSAVLSSDRLTVLRGHTEQAQGRFVSTPLALPVPQEQSCRRASSASRLAIRILSRGTVARSVVDERGEAVHAHTTQLEPEREADALHQARLARSIWTCQRRDCAGEAAMSYAEEAAGQSGWVKWDWRRAEAGREGEGGASGGASSLTDDGDDTAVVELGDGPAGVRLEVVEDHCVKREAGCAVASHPWPGEGRLSRLPVGVLFSQPHWRPTTWRLVAAPATPGVDLSRCALPAGSVASNSPCPSYKPAINPGAPVGAPRLALLSLQLRMPATPHAWQ